jgi:uncharacterized protein YkwD
MFLIIVLFAIGLAGQLPASAANPPEAENLAQQVAALTNLERAKHNLPPLKYQPNLRDAAMWMAQDMADKNYFSHTDSLGRKIGERFPAFGYTPFSMIAENICAGHATPEAAIAAWMDSDGHRKNILRDNIREIGVGYGYNRSSDYKRYWAQGFGARSNVFPLIIEGEAISTASHQVELYIYGEGWAEEMRLSNDGSTWTDWQSYQATLNWDLAPADAALTSTTRTVYVELRKGSTVRTAEDSIELTAESPGDPATPTPGATPSATPSPEATSTPDDPADPDDPPISSSNNQIYLPLILAPVPAPITPPCSLNSQENEIADLLNGSAEQQSVAMRCDPILAQVAREKATDMANRDYFSHVTPEGIGPNYLVQQAGYVLPGYYGDDLQINYIESLAAGRSTAGATWNQWMTSETHRNHLLGLSEFYAKQVEYGIGYAFNPNSHYQHYWTVIIAEPGS